MNNQKKTLVIKIGSAVLMDSKTEKLQLSIIDLLVDQVNELQKKYNIILVTSGAVSAGSGELIEFSSKNSNDKKAAAAIGNPILINKYQQSFNRYKLSVALILCERHHFANNQLAESLQSTVQNLWANKVIPIFNENDPISDYEIQFSDNDHLSVLVSILFSAKKLLLGTVVDGLMNSDGKVIPEIKKFSREIFSLVDNGKRSIWGLGGMISKLSNAKIATKFGIKVVIFNAKIPNNILQAIESKSGTSCLPQNCPFSDKQKELIRQIPSSKIFLNELGFSKYQQGYFHENSLKTEDVKNISKQINDGEVVEIFSEEDNENPLVLGIISLENEEIPFSSRTPNSILIQKKDLISL